MKRQTIELKYSPFLAMGLALLLVVLAGFSGWWGVVALFSDHIPLRVGGLIIVIAAAPLLWGGASKLFEVWRHWGDVVVSLGAHGVTDFRKDCSFIPWKDIGQIGLGFGESASYLCFEFRQRDAERQDKIFFRWFRSLRDWNVNLRLLDCRNAEVLAQARSFHQQALRAHIAKANASNSTRWSGTL